MESISHGNGLGMGGVIRINGGICVDGMGYHAWSLACCIGLVGSAIDVEHSLVVDVLRFAPTGIVAGGDECLVACGVDRSQNLQVDKT